MISRGSAPHVGRSGFTFTIKTGSGAVTTIGPQRELHIEGP
jgi:hypothetical protein